MSWQATAHVLRHSRSTLGSRLVLLALGNYSNDDNRCWPKLYSLAQDTRLSERQVRRCLRDLEEIGEIETCPQGYHRANVYQLFPGEKTPAYLAEFEPLFDDERGLTEGDNNMSPQVKGANIAPQKWEDNMSPHQPDTSDRQVSEGTPMSPHEGTPMSPQKISISTSSSTSTRTIRKNDKYPPNFTAGIRGVPIQPSTTPTPRERTSRAYTLRDALVRAGVPEKRLDGKGPWLMKLLKKVKWDAGRAVAIVEEHRDEIELAPRPENMVASLFHQELVPKPSYMTGPIKQMLPDGSWVTKFPDGSRVYEP